MREEEITKGVEGLWEAYRQATPEPEPSVNFMPELWGRIEAARPTLWAVPLRRWALRLLPLAAAVTLAMGLYVWTPRSTDNHAGYVDVLAADLMEDQELI